MATVRELEAAGHIARLESGLPPRTQEERIVHVSPRLQAWIENELPNLGSSWNIETSPLEQLAELVETFCAGGELVIGHTVKCLRPIGNGVWELKTADLRIFGWFHSKDCFIGYCADTADRIKTHDLYAGYIGEVIRFRDGLLVDEPKFIAGEDPNAVVSNFSFP